MLPGFFHPHQVKHTQQLKPSNFLLCDTLQLQQLTPSNVLLCDIPQVFFIIPNISITFTTYCLNAKIHFNGVFIHPHLNTFTNLSPYSVEVQWYASSASPSIQCQTQLVIIDHPLFHFVTCFRSNQIRSDQLLSHVRLFATPWVAARQASLSITNPRSSLSLTSIESVMPSSHLILSRPLLLLPPIPLSIRVFSYESTLHMRWPK